MKNSKNCLIVSILLFLNFSAKSQKSTLSNKAKQIVLSNQAGTFFGSSNDLYLKKIYAAIDAKDKSISLGMNLSLEEEGEKPSLLITAGLKLKSSNNFATIINNEGALQRNNIGANIKFSYVGKGDIDTDGHEESIHQMEEYTNNTDKKDTSSEVSKKVEEIINNRLDRQKAKEESFYLEKGKMYKSIALKWCSFEIYIPAGQEIYNITTGISTPLTNTKFYNISGNLTGSMMWKYSAGISLAIKAAIEVKNNNNILVDNLSSKAFQSIQTGANNTQIITETNSGYVTQYREFLTSSISLDPSFFFLNGKYGSIGFSPSIQANLGTYNKINWKLGLPISIKNKWGEPTVNFEIQWKEQKTFSSSQHLFGISSSFLFGDLIN